MKEPKTIKGYMSIIRKVVNWNFFDKKGFDSLPIEEQRKIGELIAAIENRLADIDLN